MKFKALFIGLLAAMTVVSCGQKEDFGYDPDLKTLSVKVEEAPSTKVGFTDGAAEFFWTAEDQIGVNTATTKRFFPMTLSSEAGKATGTFSANLANDPAGYAVYPYNSNWALAGTNLTYTLPNSYTYESVDSEYAKKDGQSHNAAMWGTISNNSVYFKHLGGVIAFELNYLPAETQNLTLTVKSESDKTLCGEFVLDLTEQYPVLASTDAVDGDGSTVTVTFNTQVGQTKAYVYLPVPTGEIGNMEVTIANGSTSYINYYDNVVINRGDIKRAQLFFGNKELSTGGENGVVEVKSVEDVKDALKDATSEEDITIKISNAQGADNDIVLPSSLNAETTTFTFDNVEDNTEINVSNEAGASYDGQVIFEIPEGVTGVTITANVPDGEVYIKQGTVTKLVASSAQNTTIIGAGATVSELIVAKGNVRIEVGGEVDKISRTTDNSDDFTFVYCAEGTQVNIEAGIILINEKGEYMASNATEFLEVVKAVKDDITIKLTGNVTFDNENRVLNSGSWYDGMYYTGDKSFTIDLGGYTIGHDGAVNDYLLYFKNDGDEANTITLKNGTVDAGTAAYSALATATSNIQKTTINLENIKLVNNNSNGAVVKFRGGCELNVKEGTVIEGKNSYTGIEAVGDNTVVNIYEGVKIYQKGTSSYVGAIVGASYNATMNIYGGEGVSAKCGIIVMSTGATINVFGGNWTANTDGSIKNDNSAVLVSQNNRYESAWACKSVLNVTGGTFKGGYNCYGQGPGQEPDDAQINIKGGNFNADPATYVTTGYEAILKDGVYTVSPWKVGSIVMAGGVKSVIYEIAENQAKAVSVEELNLKDKKWQDAMDWATNLGNGWSLASMDDLNKIYDLRCELNDVLEADNAENALFWEGDELYIKNGSVYYALYMSSDETPAGGKDANGNDYFANRVFFKIFNELGYSDVLYSAFDCINKGAPLRDNYFARGVISISLK